MGLKTVQMFVSFLQIFNLYTLQYSCLLFFIIITGTMAPPLPGIYYLFFFSPLFVFTFILHVCSLKYEISSCVILLILNHCIPLIIPCCNCPHIPLHKMLPSCDSFRVERWISFCCPFKILIISTIIFYHFFLVVGVSISTKNKTKLMRN